MGKSTYAMGEGSLQVYTVVRWGGGPFFVCT